MPWLLASPGHQQHWHWICSTNVSLSFTKKDFSYLRHLSVEKWQKIQTLLQWRHNGRDCVSYHQPYDCLLTQPFIQAQIKENIKAPRHWPLCGEFTGDRWIPRTNGQQWGKFSIGWRHHDFYVSSHKFSMTRENPSGAETGIFQTKLGQYVGWGCPGSWWLHHQNSSYAIDLCRITGPCLYEEEFQLPPSPQGGEVIGNGNILLCFVKYIQRNNG